MPKLTYIIITPAHNEERFIDKVIMSMIRQTIAPLRWIIVNDGSIDRTAAIVHQYAQEYSWIELVELPVHRDRQFAAKVTAFNAGYEKVKNIKFDIIGNLDADLSFEPDYFEYLIDKMIANPALGVTGTPFKEKTGQIYNFKYTNIEHVSGACQLFRHDCFNMIGGYTGMPGGGEDFFAVTSARMKGWQTRTYTDKYLLHHRPMGTGTGNIIRNRIQIGKEDYYLGNHFLWELFRAIYQMRFSPHVWGGILILWGYVWSAIKRIPRQIPSELILFIRMEQMRRLREKLGMGLIMGNEK